MGDPQLWGPGEQQSAHLLPEAVWTPGLQVREEGACPQGGEQWPPDTSETGLRVHCQGGAAGRDPNDVHCAQRVKRETEQHHAGLYGVRPESSRLGGKGVILSLDQCNIFKLAGKNPANNPSSRSRERQRRAHTHERQTAQHTGARKPAFLNGLKDTPCSALLTVDQRERRGLRSEEQPSPVHCPPVPSA